MQLLPMWTSTIFRYLSVAALLCVCVPVSEAGLGGEPFFAQSAADPALVGRIAKLGPTVDPEEARRVAYVAYTTGRELQREWQMVWPPGYHNFLIRIGKRKAGMCFQFAAELLLRLDA